MNSYQLISQLVGLVEEFDNNRQNQAPLSLADFTGFLNAKLLGEKHNMAETDVRFGSQSPEVMADAYQLDNNIARLFIYMSRYAKSYIKKTIAGTSLVSAEDFTSLAILMTHSSLSKTELLQLNLLEKTSGTEVINRLLANGLAIQWDNQIDKRTKRIAITEKGRQLLYPLFSDMGSVGKLITGKLSLPEKITLQYLLQQLENFHYPVHCNKQITNKADLINFSQLHQ
ncbi:MAG: hypothetical protein EON51_18935 [Acinetobacter sp.]|nr:MAG: hypothetical protein EON51_18935 [Acinetobacter sp.]